MIRAGFLASTPAAPVPLQNSVIGVGAGTLFLVIGLLIVTGYRASLAHASLAELAVRVFG
jgi:hypothetical protein